MIERHESRSPDETSEAVCECERNMCLRHVSNPAGYVTCVMICISHDLSRVLGDLRLQRVRDSSQHQVSYRDPYISQGRFDLSVLT